MSNILGGVEQPVVKGSLKELGRSWKRKTIIVGCVKRGEAIRSVRSFKELAI